MGHIRAAKAKLDQKYQKTLHAELYNQVDAFANLDDNARNANQVGQKFILPATFQGSSRDMLKNHQDAMAISRDKGLAHLFATMTANPNWREIREALLPGQTAQDHPDLVYLSSNSRRKLSLTRS